MSHPHPTVLLPVLDPHQVPPTRSLWREVFSRSSWAVIIGTGDSPGHRVPSSMYTPLWMFGCLLLQINLLWIWLGVLPVEFTVVQFLCLRLLYNGGMGLMLLSIDQKKSSNKATVGPPSVLRLMKELITWLRKQNPRALDRVLQASILDHNKMKKEGLGSGTDLAFSSHDQRGLTSAAAVHLHPSVQAWLMFRMVFGPVISMDLVAHFVMCVAHVDWEEAATVTGLSGTGDTGATLTRCRYAAGLALVLIAVYVKRAANGVLGTYGWFLGDFFFLLPSSNAGKREESSEPACTGIKSSGIFSTVPHPMYTVGYSFYYGFALITGSWTVLLVSLVAHVLGQICFFLYVIEIPHMNRVYGAG